MAVVLGERDDLRREGGRQGMLILRTIDADHRFHAGERSGLRRDRRGIGAEERDRDLRVRNGLCARDAFGRGGIQRLAVVFTDDEYLAH